MALLLAWSIGATWAQPAQLPLRTSPLLEEAVSDRQKKEAPTFVQAQQLTVRPDLDVQLQGQATIRRPGLSIRADRLDYDQTQDEVKASGDVRVSRDGSLFVGPSLVLQMDSFRGQLMQPRFELYKSSGYGDAASLVFLDSDRAVMQQVSYTTCRRKPATPRNSALFWRFCAGRNRPPMPISPWWKRTRSALACPSTNAPVS